MAEVIPITVTETVQARGETVTRTRETVQHTASLPPVYTLRGETMYQKAQALKQWIAGNRVFNQLELLGYLDDLLAAPIVLETTEVVDIE